MSKAVMISIKPKWVRLIASGQKTVEVRKTRPKIDAPFKCYIYCTKAKEPFMLVTDKGTYQEGTTSIATSVGKVIGEFVCDNIKRFDVPYPAYRSETDKGILEESCLTYWQLHRYAYHDDLYGWHISNLKMYDKPKELSKFCNGNSYLTIGENGKFTYTGMTRPPQSWGYVEELK